MATVLLYILFWILFVVLFFILFLMFFWMWSSLRAKVPFVPVPNSIMPAISETLDVKKGNTVYDLGCGDGRVLFYMAKLNPDVEFIGIENSPFPYSIARVLNWWHRKKGINNVKILKENFFDHNLSNATHIFTYLYPQVMDDLLSKFDLELLGGTKLVSATFKFTLKPAIEEVDLNRGKKQLARKLYVYEF